MTTEEPTTPETKTVTLTPGEWQQVIGILEQGSAVICSQLALQPNGVKQVQQLSAISVQVTDSIKQQVG